MLHYSTKEIYGYFRIRRRKFKVDETGEHYVKDENGQLIPDGWDYYRIHLCWANALCSMLYLFKNEKGEKMMQLWGGNFFADVDHARRCFKAGWQKDINMVSARLNIATKCGRSLLPIFVKGGVKVTPYYKPLKKKKLKVK